jgi:hypothetical protein
VTARQPLNRQEQTIDLGPRHGYRVEGDHVFLNADLLVPQGFGAEVALELWAAHKPHREGSLGGFKLASLMLELPTPIGSYVHHVDTRVAARLPLQGRAYSMILSLVERGPDGQEAVHAFANYPDPQSFIAPRFEGTVGYRVEGSDVVLQADGIFNPRADTNLSGTLSIELRAYPESRSGASNEGVLLTATEVEPLGGQARLTTFERRLAFNEPPAGTHRIALLLCEWTFASGYVARDRRDFSGVYEGSAPDLTGAAELESPATAAAAARPLERLRLVPPVPTEPVIVTEPLPAAPAPAVATAASAVPETAAAEAPANVAEATRATIDTTTPAKAAAGGLVSIQTGTIEELAAVKGLTPKLAKEIIKNRPFTSLGDLVRVRGIGDKSLVRLKGLLKL